MRTVLGRVALLAFIVMVTTPGAAQSVDRVPVRELLKFVDLSYPPDALAARARGFVVLALQVDDQGRVSGTEVLSGEPLLAAPAATNAREWVFSPVAAGRTVLVYRFDIESDRCNDDTRSLFRLPSPALAIVTACTSAGRNAVSPWTGDAGDIVVQPPLAYPQIAQSARVQGTVVVRVSIAGNGSVTEVTPLRSIPILIEAALANARTWKFAPNKPRETVLVYDFALSTEFSPAKKPCETMDLNEIVYPRFLRIMATPPCAMF
jgi:TonB family protein